MNRPRRPLTTPDLQWMYRWGDDEAGDNPEAALFNDLSVEQAGVVRWASSELHGWTNYLPLKGFYP